MTARLLAFPVKVSAPVENIRWRGRYPRGVASLRQARWKRSLSEMKKADAGFMECAKPVLQGNRSPDLLSDLSVHALMLAASAKMILNDLEAFKEKEDGDE